MICSVLTPQQVPYRPYLFQQLSHTFDVYLDIVHCVDRRIRVALNRDTQEWRLWNECLACFYHLEDEPTLSFNWLHPIMP